LLVQSFGVGHILVKWQKFPHTFSKTPPYDSILGIKARQISDYDE